MTNPMPATKAEVGKPTKLSREMERKLKRMRKDEPGASDVHVDAPLGSARKPRKRRKPQSKVRVIRKAELDDSRMREVIAAQLDLLVEPALPVLTHALETQNPDLVLSAMGMQMWQMRFASAVEEALLAEVGRAGFEHYDVMAKAAPKLRFRFDVKDMAVRRWARKRSSDLVVEVSRNVRENIRAAVTRIYRLGVGPREGAKLVRAALGKRSALFERWALHRRGDARHRPQGECGYHAGREFCRRIFPKSDLDHCIHLDAFDFAMPVTRENGRLVMCWVKP